MKNILSSIRRRHQEWEEGIDFSQINKTRFIFHLVGWIFTFFFIIVSIEIGNFKWMQVWIVFHIFFWYHVNITIVQYIKPPINYLLLTALLLSVVQNWILGDVLKTIPTDITLGFFPTIILLLQVLLFGLIIVSNSSMVRTFEEKVSEDTQKLNTTKNRIKQKSLILYALIGYLAYHVVFFEFQYILYLFQFFLLLTLLNKTNWLERLNKTELIIYFWLFVIIFYFYQDPPGLQTVRFIETSQKVTWFALPFYLHLLIKMYLLAVVIKIPVVVIYNHATLSRKMWIAGLFQSTFPQFIQFFFLCFIFFSLISSWQAENLREALDRQSERIKNGKISSSLTYSKVSLRSGVTQISVTEYLPVEFLDAASEHGVLSLTKTHKRAKRDFNKEDYFLFVRSAKRNQEVLYLVKMDTAFISLLTKDLSFLAGSGIILYPFAPRDWQRLIFDLQLFQDEEKTKIYPFGILSLNESWSILSKRSTDESNEKKVQIFGREDIFGNRKFILGRVFTPVVNAASKSQAYFAFDIYINLQSIFIPSTVGKVLWGLLLLFLLFNSLIIRQVGKFGSQINKIILQKFSQLKIGIQHIARGNLDYKFNMEGEDEFVELAGHFNEMSIKLKSTIAEAREKERLDQELKIAREVQLSLLPSKLPEIEGYKIAASIKTANEIGGDFYDIVPIDKNKFLFTIGDVSGKGSSAAFYMAQFISLLRYSRQFTKKPDEIAIRMNKYFSTQIVDRQIFITAIIGILDLQDHYIEIVRAGHTLPILLPGDINQGISEISLKGLGLGLTKTEQTFKKKIELKRVPLSQGDLVAFYTDGVVEAAHPLDIDGDLSEIIIYGDDRFKDLLNSSRELDSEEMVNVCTSDLNNFYSNHPRVDDHTLFFLQRKR